MSNSKYDESKDVVIEELGQVGESEMFAEVRAYADGAPKLVVYRVIGKNKDKRKQELRVAIEDVPVLASLFANFVATHVS